MSIQEVLREVTIKGLKEFIKQHPEVVCAIAGIDGKQFLIPDNKKKRELFRSRSVTDRKI
jgi:hypothetical protein